MKAQLFCIFILLPSCCFSQKLNKYWVEFTDKNDNPYCTCRPGEFLSARSLERRTRAGIEVLENDLPVSPPYLKALKANGMQIHGVSKWLNAATVMADSAAIKKIEHLIFIKQITYIGPHLKFRNPPNRPAKTRASIDAYPLAGGDEYPMGHGTLQNSFLGILSLYDAGIRGDGIWVAVMDGGFTNADTIPLFDSVALQGRLHPGWDFVENDIGIFEAAGHGTSVLSVMASNLPGYFVGTAPNATYFLIKTEDTGGEFPVEEANWISGAEWADSIGVDVINASLGYTSFNDTTLSHTYADLDGKTSIASRGATIAASKGMIICNSAGNEGYGTWRYIGVPADAPGVIAVGAMDYDRSRSGFSSVGPTADGRIKPDLVAPGDEIVVAGNVGLQLGYASGTSMASPMLAGSFATLWSAYPDKTAKEILNAVFASADQYLEENNDRGWGLPDFTDAWLTLGDFVLGNSNYRYDAISGELNLLFANEDQTKGGRVQLLNLDGNIVREFETRFNPYIISTLPIDGLNKLPTGAYWLRIFNEKFDKRYFIALWP